MTIKRFLNLGAESAMFILDEYLKIEGFRRFLGLICRNVCLVLENLVLEKFS